MHYRRGDRWCARVYDRRSKKQRWLGTFDTEEAARVAEAEFMLRAEASDRIPFTSLVGEWLSQINVRARTRRDYETTCRQLVGFFGAIPVGDITPRSVDQFVTEMSRRYSPYTVRKQITRLRQVLTAAVRWGYLYGSPASGRLALPTPPRRQVVPLSPAEAFALVEAAEPYYQPLFLTAIQTGLRQSELFGLRWPDVDFEAGTLTVRQTMYHGELVPPKSSASCRTLHLPRQALQALMRHHEVCPDTRQQLVFPAPWGRYLNTRTFSESVMLPTAARAGLPDVRLHDLRHSFASLLISTGQSPKYIQTAMGHSSISITYDVYGHLFPNEGKRAAEVLGNWFGSISVAEEAEGDDG